MKKIVIALVVLVAVSFGALAQKTEYELQRAVFAKSMRYQDFTVAKNSLYKMMVLKPENTALMDTLAALYYQSNSLVECILISTDILAADGSNANVLNLKAISEERLGMLKEALTDYENLFKLKQNPYDLYQIASLQYRLKRYGECEQTIGALLNSPKLNEMKLAIANNGTQQEVPMAAAAHNMLGVMYIDLGKDDVAKAALEKAIAIFPDFGLAQGNIKSLESKETGDTQKVEEPAVEEKPESGKKKKR